MICGRTLTAIICSFALMGICGFAVEPVNDAIRTPVQSKWLDVSDSHASASLLGQFRTNLSAWLWMRADLYLHNGVQMRPLTDQERHLGRRPAGSSDHDLGRAFDDEALVTVVPPAERDFRGLFGDVERATSAYRDMTNHSHNDPKAALPLFRLMTLVDPGFIPGWTTGASVLARGGDRSSVQKAIKFLEDGEQNNPESISILCESGHLMASKLHDLPSAVTKFEKARQVAKLKGERLSEEETETLLEAYRWLLLCYRDLGDQQSLQEVTTEARAKFPDDRVLQRLSKQTEPKALEYDEHHHDTHHDHHDCRNHSN